MSLKPMGDKCRIEVYGPDEDGTRLICANVSECPLGHPGEIGLDCFGPIIVKNLDFTKGGSVQIGGLIIGAGNSKGKSAGESMSGAIPGRAAEPDIPKVEPGAEKAMGEGNVSAPGLAGQEPEDGSPDPTASDSHMVVADDEKWWLKDMRREAYMAAHSYSVDKMAADRDEMVQRYVDKLNEISMEMYLEERRPVPPPVPILGPRESEEFLKKLDDFKLTPEQVEFYREANRLFRSRRIKHRKRYTVRRSGGMIGMRENKPKAPEPEEESLFEVEEMQEPVLPDVKAEPELQKPVPKVERPDEPEEEDELEAQAELESAIDDSWEQVIEEFETEGLGYVCGLEVFTDEDGDHVVTLTLDNLSLDIMLTDFLEMLAAFNKVRAKLVEIGKT